jgi:hypothetical protein
MDPESGEPHTPEEGYEGERPFSPVGIVILLVLVGGGIFLVFRLRDMSSVQDCIWSGRRNCAPVEVPSGR